ncbi:cellobiose phosphorylase [Natronincola peptidivorans]|uniref:Cellobiose phosphorylase n=1 Tax=Natronincola peptidivorans TaxID=426128 RepID=A0A1I0GJX3_9FIRM|nr:glycosyl transferase [Natronincola peptidivorans]SET71246.1 cellobiose phosphorylase [Natronincola peptidivorans]
MEYGYFDNENKEYVITDPRTPVTWINYIGNLKFGGFVDQTGGALICKGDPALNRIIKYIPQLPNGDFKGETLYLRVKETTGYKVFSPFYTPTLDKYDLYQCHVGLGYTKIISKFYGIRTEVTIFVPLDEEREIRDITITNNNKDSVMLDIIPVVEYTHFDALKQLTNADWVPQTMQSKAYKNQDGYNILTQYAFMKKNNGINYFTSNHPVASFETDRKRFLGNNGYSSWSKPYSLMQENLTNYEAFRGDNIAALMHHLGELKPGESRRIITQLGQCSDLIVEQQAIEKYRDEKNVEKAFGDLKKFWNTFLDNIIVDTPDDAMNTMLNIHNPRQCYITKNWSRDLSLYQLGFGGRGIGFRDSSQDVMGILGHAPEDGRELIEKLLHVQKRDGSAMHQFNITTMEANAGDSREKEDRPDYYSDDHLWIILAVCSYIKETGNFDFLMKEIPFYDKDKEENPLESANVLEHLKRSIEFTRKDTGDHGLPLLGFADWNDTVNLPTGAESIFTANLFGLALKEMIELLSYLGDASTVQEYKMCYKLMQDNLNKYCWDGEWYVRYFDHNGEALGSRKNQHGKIYANAQSWSIISGFAPFERAIKALNSVNKYLSTEHGIKLSYPGYNGYNPEKGGITSYPPGAKENGGIFLHSNPWVMIAETIVGNGDLAFQYYNQINPVKKNMKVGEYECEPYCYPQNILGDEHPEFGLGRNTWLSGTASWVYQAAIKFILGIQPTYKGLNINPCIPKTWKGFKVTRTFRNAIYEIEVNNPDNICKGVKQVIVDGVLIDGEIIPIFNDRKKHEVKILMGQ